MKPERSCRRSAMFLQLQLSRTTVETAYMLLAADGYIISRPQSGFYVTDAVLAAANREEIEHGVPHQEERPEIRYDFASSNVDRESFQFDFMAALCQERSAPG